jgi:hypothetical protein
MISLSIVCGEGEYILGYIMMIYIYYDLELNLNLNLNFKLKSLKRRNT